MFEDVPNAQDLLLLSKYKPSKNNRKTNTLPKHEQLNFTKISLTDCRKNKKETRSYFEPVGTSRL